VIRFCSKPKVVNMKHHRPTCSVESQTAAISCGPRTKTAVSLLAMAAGLLLWPHSAAAETTIGVELNVNDASNERDATDPGAGVDVTFGPRLDLKLLALTTEISAGFHDFGGRYDPTVYRILAGGRLGLGFILRPSIFAHLGVGHVREDELFGLGREGRTNLAGDVGLALDFTLLPVIDIGIQGSYNAVAAGDDSDAFEWLQAGAHVTFVLDSNG
jgi:hypothetical protein